MCTAEINQHWNIWGLAEQASRIGRYAFMKMCAKRGIPLEVCHFVICGALPRFAV